VQDIAPLGSSGTLYPPMRRLLTLAVAVAVVAAVVAGLRQADGGDGESRPLGLSSEEVQRRLAGAPAPLAALHRQANRLLPADTDEVRARLRSLRGHPVVLNKWASWCAPCRAEFPHFQRLGVEYGRRIAFLGLDSGDNRGDATAFLRRFPVSYPSYEDPGHRIATALGIPPTFPVTVIYDAAGRKFVHQGVYLEEADLREDIERYALGRGARA
jgi:cytochrome c biogenesis protein CcmG/thiol:disulfide interchange protein DsbE